MDDRILLILDLDETLIHAAEEPPDRTADRRIGPYVLFFRPYLNEFLSDVFGLFEVAIWSSAIAGYVEQVVREIMPSGLFPSFVWSRTRCTTRFDYEKWEPLYLKDLKKVKRRGYDLARILIVDDSPEKVQRHYGNAIYVNPYYAEADDNELLLLSDYLKTLATAEGVRRIEKRGWRLNAMSRRTGDGRDDAVGWRGTAKK